MYAVIRVRGNIGVRKPVKDTLRILRLNRVNHLALVSENKEQKGMIEKAKDYVTYGEISNAVAKKLFEKRARLAGNVKIDGAFLKDRGFSKMEGLVKAVLEGNKSLSSLGIKPVFRLNPPKKGFERAGIKKSIKEGGALDYRGGDINRLILKMV